MTERILLVEDEEDLRMTLSDRLKAEGYALDAAADGEAGLRKAVEGAYDLVVLDVMPRYAKSRDRHAHHHAYRARTAGGQGAGIENRRR